MNGEGFGKAAIATLALREALEGLDWGWREPRSSSYRARKPKTPSSKRRAKVKAARKQRRKQK